jgi:hypothetical protein
MELFTPNTPAFNSVYPIVGQTNGALIRFTLMVRSGNHARSSACSREAERAYSPIRVRINRGVLATK